MSKNWNGQSCQNWSHKIDSVVCGCSVCVGFHMCFVCVFVCLYMYLHLYVYVRECVYVYVGVGVRMCACV